jgi:hypothetical protein
MAVTTAGRPSAAPFEFPAIAPLTRVRSVALANPYRRRMVRCNQPAKGEIAPPAMRRVPARTPPVPGLGSRSRRAAALCCMICASRSVQKITPSRSSTRRRALKLSINPFSQCLPGNELGDSSDL